MNRNDFIKNATLFTAGLSLISFSSCSSSDSNGNKKTTEKAMLNLSFTLPPLMYAYDALAPAIDAETMEIHHTKHHAGYVKKLNTALKDYKGNANNLEELLQQLTTDEKNTKLRQNGGGHYNHSLFWNILKPEDSNPSETFKTQLKNKFGSMESLKSQLVDNGLGVFGSGWTWLSVNDEGNLFLSNTENQDNPLMNNIVEEGGTPILGIDVWEHAYYLNYQNERANYLKKVVEIINWKQVEANYEKAVG